MRETLPDIKLICLLRDPVDRAYSHYQMSLRDGQETLSFDAALDEETPRLDGEVERMLREDTYYGIGWHMYSYQARGVYVDQLLNWIAEFGRNQLLILRSEELYRDPRAVLRRVFGFLNLPPSELPQYSQFNHAPYPDLQVDTERRLIAYFRPLNQRLDELLEEPFSAGRERWQ